MPGDELAKLVADFGKIPPDVRRDLRTGIREAAEPILSEAKSNASWSSRIPRATRVAVGFGKKSAGVSIVVSSRRAPHARPYEHDGEPGSFRHPVYGKKPRQMVFGRNLPGAFEDGYKSVAINPKDRKRSMRRAANRKGRKGPRWVRQTARPFLYPAAEDRADDVAEAVREVVLDVARKNGWH